MNVPGRLNDENKQRNNLSNILRKKKLTREDAAWNVIENETFRKALRIKKN